MFKNFTKGITKRWMLNNVSVIVTIVILLVISSIFAVSYLYGNSVSQVVSSASNELTAVFPNHKTENSNSFITT